jgi:hypothetical protein
LQFVGGGEGSGTNVSLDRTYVIAASGRIATIQSVDVYFAEAAVMLGAQGILFSGANNGLFYCSASRMQSTAVTNLVDFGTSVWSIVTSVVIDFRGVAGTTAIAGLASSGNISVSGSGQFANCTVQTGLIAQSGIDSADERWRFESNFGIPDSQTIVMGYITTPATTNVISGTDVQIAGTWTTNADSSRASFDATGVCTFTNNEEERGDVHVTFTAEKVSGSLQSYQFKIQKNTGSGWTDVEGAQKTASVTSGATSSITIIAIARYVDGDQFRIVVNGVGTADDIDVTVTNFVIGS